MHRLLTLVAAAGFVLAAHSMWVACGANHNHKVSGSVESNHNMSFDLKHCKLPNGDYRTKCVDDFHAAWKAGKVNCKEDDMPDETEALRLEEGGAYETKFGDTITIVKEELKQDPETDKFVGAGVFLGEYTAAGEGRKKLIGTRSRWNADGTWAKPNAGEGHNVVGRANSTQDSG